MTAWLPLPLPDDAPPPPAPDAWTSDPDRTTRRDGYAPRYR